MFCRRGIKQLASLLSPLEGELLCKLRLNHHVLVLLHVQARRVALGQLHVFRARHKKVNFLISNTELLLVMAEVFTLPPLRKNRLSYHDFLALKCNKAFLCSLCTCLETCQMPTLSERGPAPRPSTAPMPLCPTEDVVLTASRIRFGGIWFRFLWRRRRERPLGTQRFRRVTAQGQFCPPCHVGTHRT